MEINRNGKVEYDLVIYGLKKFTGGLGDEDEIDREEKDWEKYFLKSFDQTQLVIGMQKANGESAHMSCRWIEGKFFIISGSKNVHLLFSNRGKVLFKNHVSINHI